MITEAAIDVARNDYVPIADHSTNLFFLIGKFNTTHTRNTEDILLLSKILILL